MYSCNEDEDKESNFKCTQLDPITGNVAFAAGKDGWGFTLTKFFDIWKKKKQLSTSSILKRLWGDNYYNPKNNKWQTTSEDEEEKTKLNRGFCQYVLEPIYKILNVCIENNMHELESLCVKLNFKFKLRLEEKDSFSLSGGKELMKHFMKKWLPAADALLELIIFHLPCPIESQRYRVDHLYEGPLDDQAAIGIRECDSNGPLMIYISKMIPDAVSKTKFYAFGRVFSGTVEPNQKVRIMSPDYKVGSENGLYLKNLTNCVAMIGDKPLGFDKIPVSFAF
jgi:elongation factor 2